MSDPNPPTNLSQKFAALAELMTTQHNALMNEITALRGAGPENTIKSVNQSIWKLAGAAPGTDLTELKAAIAALGDGKSLASLFSQWDPTIAGPTATSRLLNIYSALTGSHITHTQSKDILLRLIAQFDESVVTPTMKDLLVDVADKIGVVADNTTNPMSNLPGDMCATPITNSGVGFIAIGMAVGWFAFGNPASVASWSTPPLPFYLTDDPANGSYGICVDEWANYRIYVSSTAVNFGVLAGSAQRFPTNDWITLSGNDTFRFYVDGQNDLKVYICGSGGPPANPNLGTNPDPGSCGGGNIDYQAQITEYVVVDTFTDNGTLYNVFHPVMPTVEMLMLSVGTLGVGRADPAWFATHPNGFIQLCLSWDFTGNVVWPSCGRILSSLESDAELGQVNGTPITQMALGVELSPQNSMGQFEYISYSFAAPAELGMPPNVYIHLTGYPGV
jgi:hypothetical protein